MLPPDQHDPVVHLDHDVGGGEGIAVCQGGFLRPPGPIPGDDLCYKFYYGFRSSAAIFASSFIIGLSGAMMPGPLLAVTIRHASTADFPPRRCSSSGTPILEAALVCLLLFGLMEWIRGDAAIIVIALLGSAMLLRMAAGMAREVRTLHFDVATGGSAGRSDDGNGSGGCDP